MHGKLFTGQFTYLLEYEPRQKTVFCLAIYKPKPVPAPKLLEFCVGQCAIRKNHGGRAWLQNGLLRGVYPQITGWR